MRLVDADYLREFVGRFELDTREKILQMIDNAPTITPKPIAMLTFDEGKLREIVGELKQELIDGRIYLTDKRSTGHWIPKVCNFYWYSQFACSECDHEIICHEKTPNFCQNCGADMRGGKE